MLQNSSSEIQFRPSRFASWIFLQFKLIDQLKCCHRSPCEVHLVIHLGCSNVPVQAAHI